ncbi:DUF6103 family protein [Desulfosporosinus sp. FKA]|uniref:DUF6103 family protein n=1 Tax=Desulfosporosinus sp. FKA TaxID=1969834 RepID=UPI000B49867A|nr:DUF6103 family protein [Desulfosporosinus sp. FKA]
MSTTELKIPFPSERLDALRFFMEKKDQTVEQELRDYLNKTYERLVPANVREYVESRLEPETTQEQTAEIQSAPAPRERQPRTSRRQREQAAAEAPSAPEALTEAETLAEEEAQGMTMSM